MLIGDRHEGQRGEVLVAAVEVLHERQAVLQVVLVHLLLAADVEEDRHARLLRHGPERVELAVAGREARRMSRTGPAFFMPAWNSRAQSKVEPRWQCPTAPPPRHCRILLDFFYFN